MKLMGRIVLALVVLLVVPMSSVSDEASTQGVDSVEAVRQMFVGNYELVKFESFPSPDEVVPRHFVARIMYDAHGNMAAIGMPKDLPELDRASGGERVRRGGFAYFGKFQIDIEQGTVTHHLIGSPVAARSVGESWVRYYEFDGDLLTLSIKNAEGRIISQLTWKKFG